MKESPRIAMAGFATLGLCLLGVAVAGWLQGELWLPTRGFHALLARASNPLAFHALIGFYLLLAGACFYLLVLLLASPRSGSRAPATVENAKPATPMNIEAQFSISQDGRGGNITATLADGNTHSFWWEFGGGDCIAFVDVPDPSQWSRISALAELPRAQFLEDMARVVGQRKCPGAHYRIGDRSIEYFSQAHEG